MFPQHLSIRSLYQYSWDVELKSMILCYHLNPFNLFLSVIHYNNQPVSSLLSLICLYEFIINHNQPFKRMYNLLFRPKWPTPLRDSPNWSQSVYIHQLALQISKSPTMIDHKQHTRNRLCYTWSLLNIYNEYTIRLEQWFQAFWLQNLDLSEHHVHSLKYYKTLEVHSSL